MEDIVYQEQFKKASIILKLHCPLQIWIQLLRVQRWNASVSSNKVDVVYFASYIENNYDVRWGTKRQHLRMCNRESRELAVFFHYFLYSDMLFTKTLFNQGFIVESLLNICVTDDQGCVIIVVATITSFPLQLWHQ